MKIFTRTLFNCPKAALFVFLILSSANAFAQTGWTQVPTPNPSPTRNNLRGISGTSSTDIWTVGMQEVSTFPTYITNTLVLHWDGTGWQQFTTPNPGTSSNDLHDVEMLSPSKGWACGIYNVSGPSGEGLLMKWDGNSWAQHFLPNPDSAVGLWALDAVDSNNVWVVGWGDNKAAYSAHYNGSSWTQIPVPKVGQWRNQFEDVDGIAANDVWAVGSYNIFAAGDFFPLAMHWDGTSWTNFPLPPTVANSIGNLQSVKMVSANDVWAMGHSHNKLLHYDGTSWTEVSTPAVGADFAVVSANNIWDVGNEMNHWDGTSWTKTDSLTNHNQPVLGSTVVLPNGEIWAAGRDVGPGLNGIATTLVYRYINNINNTPGSISGAVVRKNLAGSLPTDTMRVWLIAYDSAANTLRAIDSVTVDSAIVANNSYFNYYGFSSVPAGSYLLKAARLGGNVGVTGPMPTYLDSSFYWNTATPITVSGGAGNPNGFIWMNTGTVNSGPGFIGGNISLGANRGAATGVPGMTILLRNSVTSLVMKSAITDANGDYSFGSIPTGLYSIYPEALNYTTTAYTNIAITTSQNTVQAINFNEDPATKTIKPRTTGIAVMNNNGAVASIYPNPAKGAVTLAWKGFDGNEIEVSITNVTGQLVHTQMVSGAPSGTATIGIARLQPGIYFVRLHSAAGNATQKLVVQP